MTVAEIFRTISEDGCVTLAKGGATFLKLCRHHCRAPATAMLVVRRLSLCTFPVAELAAIHAVSYGRHGHAPRRYYVANILISPVPCLGFASSA